MNTPTLSHVRSTAGKELVRLPFRLFEEGQTFAERDIPTRIHVVPLGSWDHPVYGEFEVTAETVREFIRNFEAGIRAENRLPITAGHDTFMENPAVGWMTNLQETAFGLYADVEWTSEGERLLREGAFKYFSPEWYTSYTDPADRKQYGHVLIGGALTNKPFFRELDAVVAFSEHDITKEHNDQHSMNLDEIRKKEAADLTDEEKSFLKEHEGELSDEEKSKFFPAEGGDSDPEGGEEGENDGAGEGDGEGGDNGDTQPNAASTVTISAAELAALRSKADQGHQAYSQLRTMTLENEANALVFSATNAAGKFLPKSKGALVQFMATLTDKQRKAFSALMAQLPATNLFSEEGVGADEGGEKGVEGEVETKVASLMEKDKSLTYSAALVKVFATNPQLEKRYNERFSA